MAMSSDDWRRLAEIVDDAAASAPDGRGWGAFTGLLAERLRDEAKAESAPSPEPDPVPVGSRWRWDDGGAEFTVVAVSGARNQHRDICYDSGSTTTGLLTPQNILRNATRIDAPTTVFSSAAVDGYTHYPISKATKRKARKKRSRG